MSSKEDSTKAKDGTVTVNVDEFTRTRDSVLVSLAQLHSAVADLSRAYINHTNTVLGRNPADLDLGIISSGITQSLYDNGLITRPSSPGAKSEAGAGDKRKRKRAPPDPNAPKRALTPYFLYMQHNRAHIAEDLGDGAKPKEVAEEGTRRWSNMPEAQKAVWKKLYLDNLAVYREKMNDYKEKKGQETGKPYDHDRAASSQLQQDVAATEAGSDDEDESDEGEHEEEPEPSPSPEPHKEPSPPRSGKRRRSDGAKASKGGATEPPATIKSPEKKKRGGATKKDKEKEEEVPASARKGADTKRQKKKRKSEAGEE